MRMKSSRMIQPDVKEFSTHKSMSKSVVPKSSSSTNRCRIGSFANKLPLGQVSSRDSMEFEMELVYYWTTISAKHYCPQNSPSWRKDHYLKVEQSDFFSFFTHISVSIPSKVNYFFFLRIQFCKCSCSALCHFRGRKINCKCLLWPRACLWPRVGLRTCNLDKFEAWNMQLSTRGHYSEGQLQEANCLLMPHAAGVFVCVLMSRERERERERGTSRSRLQVEREAGK